MSQPRRDYKSQRLGGDLKEDDLARSNLDLPVRPTLLHGPQTAEMDAQGDQLEPSQQVSQRTGRQVRDQSRQEEQDRSSRERVETQSNR